MAPKIDQDAFERRYRDYIIIPAGLLVVGTMIVKIDWTPYAALLAVVLGTWNYFSFREWPLRFACCIETNRPSL